jgi:hypothetical protein
MDDQDFVTGEAVDVDERRTGHHIRRRHCDQRLWVIEDAW